MNNNSVYTLKELNEQYDKKLIELMEECESNGGHEKYGKIHDEKLNELYNRRYMRSD